MKQKLKKKRYLLPLALCLWPLYISGAAIATDWEFLKYSDNGRSLLPLNREDCEGGVPPKFKGELERAKTDCSGVPLAKSEVSSVGERSDSIVSSSILIKTKTKSKALLAQSDCDCSGGGESLGDAGGTNLAIPFIISPRQTRLLDPKPTLRWNPVSTASGYMVRVEDDLGDIWWETETDRTEISYNGKPLERGKNYILIVEADNGAASDEGLPGLGFALLNADDAHQVNTVANLLREGELTEEIGALQLAHLYTGYGLRAEAIATLEALAKKGTKNIAVYRLLGYLYERVELNRLAESRYLKMVELATEAEDLQALATAQGRLGKVYARRGNRDRAIRWFTEALASYEKLGDSQRVLEIQRRLERLQ